MNSAHEPRAHDVTKLWWLLPPLAGPNEVYQLHFQDEIQASTLPGRPPALESFKPDWCLPPLVLPLAPFLPLLRPLPLPSAAASLSCLRRLWFVSFNLAFFCHWVPALLACLRCFFFWALVSPAVPGSWPTGFAEALPRELSIVFPWLFAVQPLC